MIDHNRYMTFHGVVNFRILAICMHLAVVSILCRKGIRERTRVYLDDIVASVGNSCQFVAAKFCCEYFFLEKASSVATIKNKAFKLLRRYLKVTCAKKQ